MTDSRRRNRSPVGPNDSQKGRAATSRLLLPCVPVLCLLVFPASCKSTSLNSQGLTDRPAGLPPAAPDAAAPREHARYTYEDVLTALRSDDSAVPAMPPVHPVHTLYNPEAIIPPMCYTQTEGRFNPCYVCHQDRIRPRPNVMNDADLQERYSFSTVGRRNHWRNLFEDRSEAVSAISDSEIRAWVDGDNYSELPSRLKAAGFRGYIPDLSDLQWGQAAFDDEGFAKDGSGWVAFHYKPLPSTFWPTNGATDDVMIRLPAAFRTRSDGGVSRDAYKANLAILEANIKGLDQIRVNDVDERELGTDLNGDGALTKIGLVTKVNQYVGGAAKVARQAYLFPKDTEFLHSVRYLSVSEDGVVGASTRMKELRYMRKRFATTDAQLYEAYMQEASDKDQGYMPGYVNRGMHGLDNEMGWVITGFIENRKGQLRFNTYEENLFCMGCHTSLGSTIDSVFSFPRKVDGAAGWGYIDLATMTDAPSWGEDGGEIATYLVRVHGGGEFRNNYEMFERWFSSDGHVRTRDLEGKSLYEILMPSPQRALQLNKAYKTIVDKQTFIFGRDATVRPATNVYDQVDPDLAPTLPAELVYQWDIRLDWSKSPTGHARFTRAKAQSLAKPNRQIQSKENTETQHD